jgi:hypothetical protein
MQDASPVTLASSLLEVFYGRIFQTSRYTQTKYKTRKHLEQTIRSVIDQNYDNAEYDIIEDDKRGGEAIWQVNQ